MKARLKPGDALLLIDPQIDFFPGGALAVPQGDEIIAVINEWIKAATQQNIPIFVSRDWHPANHCSFEAQGGQWPGHCVQDSKGAKFHPKLTLSPRIQIIDKGEDPLQDCYSAFKGKTQEKIDVAVAMKKQGIQRLWIGGLAQDYCVCDSALDGIKKGFEMHLLLQGTRAITTKTGQRALARMKREGVFIETNAHPYD